MITYRTGDIFSSSCEVLVNPVNCFGVMGAGLALDFKHKYPLMFRWYKAICSSHELRPGTPILWEGQADHRVLLFPTKNDFRKPSRIEWIEQGMEHFLTAYAKWNISSIAFPPLGCGLGGLAVGDVLPIIENAVQMLNIEVELFNFTWR